MAPLMPSEDPNSPKTRLLTLLNVSAARSSKKRRLDALLAPEEEGPRKKLNARRTPVTEPEPVSIKEGEAEGEDDESDEDEAGNGQGAEGTSWSIHDLQMKYISEEFQNL